MRCKYSISMDIHGFPRTICWYPWKFERMVACCYLNFPKAVQKLKPLTTKTLYSKGCIVTMEFYVFSSMQIQMYIWQVQVGPDRMRWSGSTELNRVIGEACIKYLFHFFGPTNFYVYGSIRYCLHYATVLLIFDQIMCVKYLEAIN